MSEASPAGRPAQQEFEKALTGATTTVASFDEERLTFLQRLQRFLHSYPTTVPFVVLALGLLLGVAVNPARFTTASNISTVLTQVMVTGILGIGQTLVILTAGIDLSIGVIMVISSVVMGRLAVLDGVPTILAFPLGLICGSAFGLLNGALVTRMRMPPFIVTLGTLSIIGALNTYYSQSETIGMQDIEDKAPFLNIMGNPLSIGSAQIMWGTFLMLQSPPSSGTFSTAPPTVATSMRRATTRKRRVSPASTPIKILLSVYVFAGLIAAIAGWALIGRVGAISPTAGENMNLNSITAVVIGGTSLFGGRGSIIGTLVGALIVGVFRSAVSLAGLDVLWQEFAIGVLIIVAVALDQWIRRVSK